MSKKRGDKGRGCQRKGMSKQRYVETKGSERKGVSKETDVKGKAVSLLWDRCHKMVDHIISFCSLVLVI